MKNIYLLCICVGFFQIGFSQSISPEVIASSGDVFTSASNSLEWTLGEVVVETFTASSTTLTQGFHQGEIIITAIEDNIVDDLAITIFPNPAQNYVEITVGEWQKAGKQLDASLWDISGKELSQIGFTPGTTPQRIDLSNISAGEYFLTLSDKSGHFRKTWKILKQR